MIVDVFCGCCAPSCGVVLHSLILRPHFIVTSLFLFYFAKNHSILTFVRGQWLNLFLQAPHILSQDYWRRVVLKQTLNSHTSVENKQTQTHLSEARLIYSNLLCSFCSFPAMTFPVCFVPTHTHTSEYTLPKHI